MSVYDDDDPAEDFGPRATGALPDDELHKLEDAHIACRAAWLYPLDHDIRAAALFSVMRLGFDYVELLAKTMEQVKTPAGALLDAEQARRHIAETFRRLAVKSYKQRGYTDPAVALLSDPDAVPDPLDPRGGDGLDAIGGP